MNQDMKVKQTVTIVGLMILTFVALQLINRPELVSPNKSFTTFPMEIDDWKGVPGQLDEKVYNILGLEDYILANYTNPSRQLVSLYVGFYQSQKEGDLIHSPKNCMPGAGWNITKSSIEPVVIDSDGHRINTIKLILEKGPEKQVVLYWFQSRGRIISSEYWQKIWLVVDSIFKHRTDGAFVRLISRVYTDEEQALETLKIFAGQVFPYLKEYLPS